MRDKDNSPLKEFFHNKYILAFLAIDIIAIVALVGVFINRSTRISTINFNVVPANATISVDGDKHYKNGQYDIAPGAYKIEISARWARNQNAHRWYRPAKLCFRYGFSYRL